MPLHSPRATHQWSVVAVEGEEGVRGGQRERTNAAGGGVGVAGGQALLQTSQPFDKHAFNLALRRQVRLCLMCLPYMSALNVGHAVLGDDMGRQRWGRWTWCGRPTASVMTAFDNGCLYA